MDVKNQKIKIAHQKKKAFCFTLFLAGADICLVILGVKYLHLVIAGLLTVFFFLMYMYYALKCKKEALNKHL